MTSLWSSWPTRRTRHSASQAHGAVTSRAHSSTRLPELCPRLERDALLEQRPAAGRHRFIFKATHQRRRIVIVETVAPNRDLAWSELLQRAEAHRLELQRRIVEQRLAHTDELHRGASRTDKTVTTDQQHAILAECARKIAALIHIDDQNVC